MNGKDSKGITLRNGWGRDWSGRSDDLVVDLVGGERGRRRNRRPPCTLEETEKREEEEGRAGGGSGATLKWMCGALLSGATFSQCGADGSGATRAATSDQLTSSASTGHVGWVCGAGRTGATWACVAPMRGAPHKRVR
jgi:hypothetical protein